MNKQIKHRIAVVVFALTATLGVGVSTASAATPASQARVMRPSTRHLAQGDHRSYGRFHGHDLNRSV
jgi:curli biogenesis system outer membrane secretion channel CsgG